MRTNGTGKEENEDKLQKLKRKGGKIRNLSVKRTEKS